MSLINQLYELECVAFPEKRFSYRQIKYLFEKGRGRFFYQFNENKLVGYIYLTPIAQGNALRVYSIAIHPDFRRKYLASLLMAMSYMYAVICGYRYIRLEVESVNRAAIALYTKEGYRQIGIKKYYYGKDDALIFQKDLCAVNESESCMKKKSSHPQTKRR